MTSEKSFKQLSLAEVSVPGDTRMRARPFLKWAGGKTNLLSTLRPCIPEHFECFFEPFLGGGALFFDLAPRKAVIGDANPELMLCFRVVKERPEDLLRQLREMRVSEGEFYQVREIDPEALPDVTRAARLIYLNKTCYNGLYRVNRKGRFNTPYGHYENASLVDAENLRRASEALQNAELVCGDYEKILNKVKARDFVYLDPPYLPVSKYSDFKRYTKEFFYEADHVALAGVFKHLDRLGCSVLLSNSYHEKIASLYDGFAQVTVEAPRFMNCKGDGRGKVKELLISNYPLRIA